MIHEFYNSVAPSIASKIHLATGTISAVLFFLYGLGMYSPAFLPLVAMLDLSTAYFVIGGSLSDRYKNGMAYPKIFFMIHVLPGVVSYAVLGIYVLLLPFTYAGFLFYIFAVLWAQAYVTGVYAFFKLHP